MPDNTYNLDKRAISAILYERDIRPFLKARITKAFFKSNAARIAYEWVRTYHDRFSKLPSRALFRQQYPSFELVRSHETTDFFAEALVSRNTYKLILETLADAGEALESDQKSALAKLTAGLERIQLSANRASDLSLRDDLRELMPRYLSRKNKDGIFGMPFGFRPLDQNTDGMVPGQLSLLFGDQGIGKSWLALIIAVSCFMAGYKVLYVTKENLDTEIANRVHAMLTHVNPHRLRKGELHEWEEKKMGRLSSRTKRLGDRFIISSQDDIEGGSLGTAGVKQKLLQYRPDIVFVDGLYLLEDEDITGPEHQTLRKIAYRLKRMARKENVHVFAVTQASAGGASSENGATSASDIAFSRAVGYAADIILNIYENDELRAQACKGIKLLKQREGPKMEFFCSWDFEHCKFEVIANETVVTNSQDEDPELPC